MSTLGLVAVAKNEGASILDWIVFHLHAGFDEIIVADDSSFDGSLELMEALERILPLQIVRFFQRDDPQVDAYAVALDLSNSDLLAFADLDEFFITDENEMSVAGTIKDIFEDNLVSAMAVNWQIAGQVGLELSTVGAPIRNPWFASDQLHRKNHYFKSVVRKSRVAKMWAHQAALKWGIYPHVDGVTHLYGPSSERRLGEQHAYPAGGISSFVIHQPLKLLHFATKGSIEDFLLNRLWRGNHNLPSGPLGFKSSFSFFDAHNPSGPIESLESDLRQKIIDSVDLVSSRLVKETSLLSGLNFRVVGISSSKSGVTEARLEVSGDKDFDVQIEVTKDSELFLQVAAASSAAAPSTLLFALPEDGSEYEFRIPGVWSPRIRLYRQGGLLLMDEKYYELTFRLSRAERLLMQERLQSIEDKAFLKEAISSGEEEFARRELELKESLETARLDGKQAVETVRTALSEKLESAEAELNALKSRRIYKLVEWSRKLLKGAAL
jgi:hypothetical protein